MSFRNTTSKSAVLEILRESDSAMSHKNIMTSLDGLCDRVTVYRVLDRLIEEGYLHKVIDLDGVMRYAACHDCEVQHHHNHVHFSCTSCETVMCIEDVQPKISLPDKFIVKEAVFTLSGLCPKCS